MSTLFWADQKAEEIIKREKYHFLEKAPPKPKKYTVKTSASLSGVLHIGRLSDTIRGESVTRGLADAGKEAELIWVAEDMDPLRKVPEGIPPEYEEYLGMPVSSVPDPWGCHDSYAEHHAAEYLEVLHEFSVIEKRYSMKREYSKGSFAPYVKLLLEKLPEVVEIMNRYRENPLDKNWSPWTPICSKCGKIITPVVKGMSGGKVEYECRDYDFEKTAARGCGNQDVADPLKDEGKLMWKGEWAAQWARWGIAAEGAGKEYVVPGSAWWVNGEIVERIFDFPMPLPIFYEHLMIDGEKMSASLGNVVYPKDWLEVAEPAILRFFYNKKLMKTRNFSWAELPNLYDEYDRHARVYFDIDTPENEKEREHMKRLYEIAQGPEAAPPLPLSFSHAAMLAQLFKGADATVKSLKRSGHYKKELEDLLLRRLGHARNWAEKHAPEGMKISLLAEIGEVESQLDEGQKEFLVKLSEYLSRGEPTAEDIQNRIYELAREDGLGMKPAFRAIYLCILGRERGPKAGTLIASLDREWIASRFSEAGGIKK